MNSLSGQEKFGKKGDAAKLVDEEKKEGNAEATQVKQKDIPDEDTFLLNKSIRCVVCDKAFKTKVVKNGRIRRLEPDMDLRPRFEHIDTLKYSVVSCPYCGYTAMNRYFEHLSSVQVRLIKEQVCSNFKGGSDVEPKVLSFDEAIERYKLSLFNTTVKKGKTSEKAYNCLNLAWVFRSKYESLDPQDPKTEQEREECKKQEEEYYTQAFEGLTKAISTENYPICGMDECTLDYLLATMACHFQKYDMASKCIARIQQSPFATKKLKDRAYDLRMKIVEDIKKSK